MKKTLLLLLFIVASASVFGQKSEKFALNLNNAVIIGQTDTPSDRYSLEVNLTELFASHGVLSLASLNLMKLGSDSQQLASDSVARKAKIKGFDTFVLVSIKGYDKRFKATKQKEDFLSTLGRANIFGIYQQDIVSVSFEFKFFRSGTLVYTEIVKCGNAGSRDKVIKKLRKKVSKRLEKSWK
ncbi:hypothetical protein OAU25_00560 [Crocinitomicaceae bacterium]|nr:hypothetical protein [Crocinitomicaceae bacterium]